MVSTHSATNEDAAIIRTMINNENRVLNDRITWLTTIQGLLFAALGFAWDKDDAQAVIIIVSCLGVSVALASWTSFTISNKARKDLDAWWEAHKPEDYDGPPVIGIRSFDQDTPIKLLIRSLRPWRSLPIFFILGWLSVLVANWARL